MKRFSLLVLALSCLMAANAVESEVPVDQASPQISMRSVTPKQDLSSDEDDDTYRMEKIWGKNTYLNISYNNTELSSKEFPSATGPFPNKFKKDIGVGLQMGQTFNFHKKPLGQVLYIGLDYTWIDFNFNKYKSTAEPSDFADADKKPFPLPWHNSKMTFDYGMSLGPALTLYPLSSLHHDGTDKIRFHLYFHVGYSVAGALIDMDDYKQKATKEFAFGHGLFTSFGATFTWNFVGFGFDVRNDGNIKYKATNSLHDTGKMKAKQKTTRFYIQFRF